MANVLDDAEFILGPRGDRPVMVRTDLELRTQGQEGVWQFLAEHEQEMALPFRVEDLRLVRTMETPVRTVYRFEYVVEGISVFEGELLAHVDRENRLRQIDIYSGPDNMVDPPPDGQLLTPEEAKAAAAKAIDPFKERLQPPAPSQVWFPTEAGLVRSYVVLIATENPAHDWQIVIDAYSGRVLLQRDLIKELPDGRGRVFDPNPVVTAGDNSYRNPAATTNCGFGGTDQGVIDRQRVSRVLKDLTVTRGELRLEGPYCIISNLASPARRIPTEASGNFSYPSNDERFEAVNVYYHIDTLQRYLQSIGIHNTYDGPNPPRADPHDNSRANSWYSPLDNGLHFRDHDVCRSNGGQDGDCIVHEYGHAIQDYQRPGFGTPDSSDPHNEAGAMGEGFGDFLACVYFADKGRGYQREVFQDWVWALQGGLRRVDGIKVYPGNWQDEVHADGEIWSSALWRIFLSIGGSSARARDREEARKAILRSVINSHVQLRAHATMAEGAEQTIIANTDLEEYRGRHVTAMLDSFHERGILPIDRQAELHLRDDAAEPGALLRDSPNVWVRNRADGGNVHEAPRETLDNWFYARVHNRGAAPCRAFAVSFAVKRSPDTELADPDDFTGSPVSTAVGFNLAAGASRTVRAKWPAELVPQAGSRGSVLGSIYTPTDRPSASSPVTTDDNLAQRTFEVVGP